MSYNAEKPYNDLPLLPPNVDIESKEILKKCISARAVLAELKQAGELIPNQYILINSILLLEAQMSSEIENIVTTTDNLFRFADGNEENADAATKETLRYSRALSVGYQSIREKPVCTRVATEVCQTILNTKIDIRKLPGTILKNPLNGQTIYTPPEGEQLIREKLSNWEKFLNTANDIDPLIRLAIMHYQFEAIHPFTDGNGRTGRVLNILFLIQQGLLDTPILYLSRYIIDNKNDYYTFLRAVTEQQHWQPWILYMLEAIEKTAQWTRAKIKAIKALMDHTCDFVRGEIPTIYSRDLVEQIFVQAYCRISNITQAGIAKRQTASGYLKKLAEIGVLQEHKYGREIIFVHPKLLNLLTRDDNDFQPYIKI